MAALRTQNFSYHRTIIVIAGVHRRLGSRLSPRTLTFRHWPGVSPYTSSCELAGTCVFGKQSPDLFCCGRWPCGHRQSLSRSYGRYFAEFLNASSLVHLGLLDHPTGVGLRYGFVKLSEAMLFLEAQRVRLTPPKRSNWYPRSPQLTDFPMSLNN